MELYLDFQSAQNNGLEPKAKGVWAITLGTLQVEVDRMITLATLFAQLATFYTDAGQITKYPGSGCKNLVGAESVAL